MGISPNVPPGWRRRLLRLIDIASRPLCEDSSSDPFHVNFAYFVEEVNKRQECSVLELGARRSTIRDRFSRCKRYVGVDIHPGADVDVVCDIHEL